MNSSLPCFLNDMSDPFSLIPHVSSPLLPPPPASLTKKKKKKYVRRRVKKKKKKMKSTVNCEIPRLPAAPSSPLCYYYYSWWQLTCEAVLRSLHRAHRLQSVGMLAGGSDGTAEKPEGRCSGNEICSRPAGFSAFCKHILKYVLSGGLYTSRKYFLRACFTIDTGCKYEFSGFVNSTLR